MPHYADSSFLVSCYHPDVHTPQAKAYLATLTAPLVFTALHDLEIRNAFQPGVFRGLLSQSQASYAWSNLRDDLRAKRLVRTSVRWNVALKSASEFSATHTAAIGTRSLDILHVAIAKSLSVTDFVSFDTRQRSLAAAVGLKVAP